jgi:hypothetical protein
LAKALKLVEHELAYTTRSKNILTLNNHAKDERNQALLKHLHELEHEIEGLKIALHAANIKITKVFPRTLINFIRGQ